MRIRRLLCSIFGKVVPQTLLSPLLSIHHHSQCLMTDCIPPVQYSYASSILITGYCPSEDDLLDFVSTLLVCFGSVVVSIARTRGTGKVLLLLVCGLLAVEHGLGA